MHDFGIIVETWLVNWVQIGVEDNKEYFYNNMAAPMQSVGDTGDKASTYNNMGAVGNCVGGTETGCTPFAVGSRAAFM